MQVCTGVMLHGYPLVKQLCGGLQVCAASPTSVFLNCRHVMARGRRARILLLLSNP